MVEGARDVPRGDQEWLFVNLDQGAILMGPGIGSEEEVLAVDVQRLERAGLIEPIRYSQNQGNPAYVLTPEAREYYASMRDSEPIAGQEAELRRFLDADAFKAEYPNAYAKWSEAEALLWRSDSERDFTTIGHKVREALQGFAGEVVARYEPPDPEPNSALVNKRLGAVIAMFLPELGERRAELLKALGDYSEATLQVVQRQEHGGQKEGDALTWQDARRAVFHAASVMYEFAESFRAAASQS